jgi:hypothetical protein
MSRGRGGCRLRLGERLGVQKWLELGCAGRSTSLSNKEITQRLAMSQPRGLGVPLGG